MDKKMMKSVILIITYCILLVAILVKIDLFINGFFRGMTILVPVFIGIAIAFILNRPYKIILELLKKALKDKKWSKAASPIALLSVYLLFIGAVTGIIAFIIPQLSDSVQMLYDNIEKYGDNLGLYAIKVANYLNLENFDYSKFDEAVKKIPELAGGLFKGIMPKVFDFTTSFFASLINIVIGFVLSVYLLADKVRLKRHFKKAIQAYLPKHQGELFTKVTRMASETFTRFVSGQFTEACILGGLCFVGMLLFKFEYPVLISVLIGLTSLIPVVGSIIGLIPSLFVLVMINPMHALWFLVFIIVLQQIEGNLIYPRVVGESIGLPPLWVLLAIIIGGGLFGVLGMLLGVPTLSVIYHLLQEDINLKLKAINSAEGREEEEITEQ